jgi:hypothetical protein
MRLCSCRPRWPGPLGQGPYEALSLETVRGSRAETVRHLAHGELSCELGLSLLGCIELTTSGLFMSVRTEITKIATSRTPATNRDQNLIASPTDVLQKSGLNSVGNCTPLSCWMKM